MLENTSRYVKLLAGAAGVTFALALAVSAGAVPTLGEQHTAQAGPVTEVEDVASPPARQPGDTSQAAAGTTATTATPPTTAAPVTTTTVAAPKPTAAPKAAKAPATTKTTEATTPPATAATVPPAVTVPAAPVKVARRVPSAAEVNQAIATLPQYVRTPFTPTPDQVDQLGDQVCTAFDQGQTFAQVKATGLSMVTQVPLTTVLPGGADWVVRTAVTLYCPGHASKLV